MTNRNLVNQDNEYFPESRYGVSASERVVFGKAVPKGGGYYVLGKPYQIKGRHYIPREYISYAVIGTASWYGSAFHGRLTANGEIYDTESLTAAHPTLPLPSYVRVTNLENGLSIVVRVNDRGPYHDDRLIDLSNAAARILMIENRGVVKVHAHYLGMAMLGGNDRQYLLSSLKLHSKPILLPVGCEYKEKVVRIPYLLTTSHIVSLTDCSDRNLQNQLLSSNKRKNYSVIPTPIIHSKYLNKKQRKIYIPVHLKKYYKN
ncbi:Lipoprotein [Candidatus Liberibacter americanus str. Sao Paulo]|uniref:Endolytic peptidoglycan transglycosylase RlpA n=2 Tax=Candidatus Liberibacter americanus TaxID=309868 RepID=U6B5F6_9HYPH|nr:septal ring lytic transglycosylase RlpA family protein [Candidatus Liberibacter americanus]AHA27943.1 Lipoprotein [Candidatus Liberibacter americanus str. Sao Paulo]